MTPMEISRQPAPRFVLRHAPRRTVAFVAIDLAWALMFGLHAVLPPTGPPWSDALGCLLGAALAYFAMVVAVQGVRGNPVLEASNAGIAINSPWGRMFVRWSETSEFSAGRYRWLQIRLREGARPVCSPWTRMLNASLWARRTIVVRRSPRRRIRRRSRGALLCCDPTTSQMNPQTSKGTTSGRALF